MPVPLTLRREDDVAGADRDDWPAAGLNAAFAFGDVERLSNLVGVPGAAGARCEVHQPDAQSRVAVALGDGVDVDVAGKPVRRALARWLPVLDFHRLPLPAHG